MLWLKLDKPTTKKIEEEEEEEEEVEEKQNKTKPKKKKQKKNRTKKKNKKKQQQISFVTTGRISAKFDTIVLWEVLYQNYSNHSAQMIKMVTNAKKRKKSNIFSVTHRDPVHYETV